MRANDDINEELRSTSGDLAYGMMSDGNKSIVENSGNYSTEIADGYFSGYELLHGTKYFSYGVVGNYDAKSQNYIFKYSLQWVDQINKNVKAGDSSFADPFYKMGAKDYWITIKWNQTITVKAEDINNGEFETGQSGQRGTRGLRR